MKIISLYQPLATLVVIGAKVYETRSWATKYRGPILIHASKKFNKAHRALTTEPIFYDAARLSKVKTYGYPTGAIVGRVWVVDCFPTERIRGSISAREYAFGDYSDGRWAWLLGKPEEFELPIAAKGSLGIWEFSESALGHLANQG